MERTERADGVTIINDAYNANPESMRAALRTLADLGQGSRTWAVLGAMLELGADSIREHTAVGTQVVRLNISRLVVVGREARALYVSAVQEGSWGDECAFAETVDEAYELPQSRTRTRRPGALQVLQRRGPAASGRSDSITPTSHPPRTPELPLKGASRCDCTFDRRRPGPALCPRRDAAVYPAPGPAKSYGQFIRDDGPTSHHTKRGTPTMGGTVVVAAVLLSYGADAPDHVADESGSPGPSASALLLLFLMVGMGLVGFLDDFIKISKQRSLGLDAKAKLILQAAVGIIFAVLALNFPDEDGADAGIDPDLPGPRHPVAGPRLRRDRRRRHPLRALVQPDRHGGHQRREPHRRP